MLPIGAFSKISNVTTNTLRYYDEINLLKPTHVNADTGYRYYDSDQLNTILLITKLKRYNFSLEEIAEVLKHPDDGLLLLRLTRKKHRALRDELERTQSVIAQLENDILHMERGNHIMSYVDQIEVKVIQTQPMNILSIREKINVSEYGKYIGMLMERVHRDKLTLVGPPMSIFHDEAYNPENYDMEIAVPVKEAAGEGIRLLEGCTCATATLKGPYSELPALYARMRQWTEREGYSLNGAPYETYPTNPADTKPEDFITEVYCPVKK